jgi:hypothetical protein
MRDKSRFEELQIHLILKECKIKDDYLRNDHEYPNLF